jgi:dienelactone hydrolase
MKKFFTSLILGVVSVLAFSAPSAWAQAGAKNVGIVLLHGKWGSPLGNIKGLADALKANGYEVTAPFMPWSTKRAYDVPYQDALNELDQIVKKYRAAGLSRVYMVGTSFGANGSIAYAAYGQHPIDGVIAIAPGHLVDHPVSWPKLYGKKLAMANELIKAGKGDELETFTDSNGGKMRDFSMKASVFVSYFGPQGMGSMSLASKRVKQPIPLVILLGGPHDYAASLGKGHIFNNWPAHPKSVYTTLEGAEHFTAPDFAIDTVLKWLDEQAK